MAEMNENAEKMNFHAEENREETVFDEVETEETKEEMEKLVQSIAEKGVVVPIIARAINDEYYEIILEHRRRYACMKLGIDTMPVIIRKLDDDEAVIAMVDSNIQREHILPSERGFSYKMKLEAIKHQGQRKDLTCSQLGNKLNNQKSIEIIAEQNDVSKNQIHRYIRLTKLIPELLQMVDDNKLKFNTGVKLSYLELEEQNLWEN
ncbi:MAG: ParB/RepB/Spo0J family partition protein [Firmicutes bacterium]|nr:ParB/RepB/Spo0J family partition protein [Bacillota bacterium]